MKLQGKNIILTGASRGFGAYLAVRLFEEGASLLLVARTLNPWYHELAERWKQPVEPFPYDLIGWNAGFAVVKKAREIWTHIDGLVNNAAIQGPVGNTWEVDLIELNRTFAVDLFAPIDLCRFIVPEMLKRGHGKIVNLSGGGATSPRPNYSAYATAKAGLVRFSECLAAELKGTGVDVNCVAPGKMPTGMLPPGETPDENSMEKAADLIVWLLSSESDGVTGRLISAIWDHWKVANLTPMSDELYTLRRIDEDHDRAYRHWKESPVREPDEGANNL